MSEPKQYPVPEQYPAHRDPYYRHDIMAALRLPPGPQLDEALHDMLVLPGDVRPYSTCWRGMLGLVSVMHDRGWRLELGPVGQRGGDWIARFGRADFDFLGLDRCCRAGTGMHAVALAAVHAGSLWHLAHGKFARGELVIERDTGYPWRVVSDHLAYLGRRSYAVERVVARSDGPDVRMQAVRCVCELRRATGGAR